MGADALGQGEDRLGTYPVMRGEAALELPGRELWSWEGLQCSTRDG